MAFDKSKPFEGEPVIEGQRRYALTKVKPCQVPKWTKTSQGFMKTQETENGLRFVFKDLNRKTWVCHTIKCAVSEKSQLFKFLQKGYNSLLTREVKFKRGTTSNGFEYTICEPEGRLIDLAHGLIGREYILDVSLKDGKWTRVNDLVLCEDSPHQLPIPAVRDIDHAEKTGLTNVSDIVDNMDIPFVPLDTPSKDDDDIPW